MSGPRGSSDSVMRRAVCKDCLREQIARDLGVSVAELAEDFDSEFVYNERAAAVKLERGQTRSDRCRDHRARHRINIQGMAVPYIDLQTIGEAIGARDIDGPGPTGPFGGLGPMPKAHKLAENTSYDLSEANVGMTDAHILQMLDKLANPQTRVLIAKAGTGTGKSTFMPYRLLDPPPGATFRLADLGPIVVTEPRVQATSGVAWYVGTILSGAGGVGPGFPVGFQVKGTKAHDESCQLIYVTDGTMINWLREGRLSTIGTVIVDEAHERSTNIDFIMGYLKTAIDRYPHLRVIVTSATFDVDFYREFFGGAAKVEDITVEAEKTIGYGFPLFADLDAAISASGTDLTPAWSKVFGTDLPLWPDAPSPDFITEHFQPTAPPLKPDEVCADWPDPATGAGWAEPLHATTKALLQLRFDPARYEASTDTGQQWQSTWRSTAANTLATYVVDLVKGLDEAGIYGDVLCFLPTTNSILEAVSTIRAGLGLLGDENKPHPDDIATVYPLISSLPTDIKVRALQAQVKGDRRKVVVSTNLAETSLTVEGVRFVVDSGLIAQEKWDPELAQGGVQTSLHSQAGIRQRWGRVGRKAPGWVFPLYTKEQFLSLDTDTAPGSTRSNLENLIMTAKVGGIDDVVNFDWPAKFWPDTWPQTARLHTPPTEDPAHETDEGIEGTPYEAAARSRRIFRQELERADRALRASGATDDHGDPTPFGKELGRAPGLEKSELSKIALMHADRLACVPEVVTILALLESPSPLVRHNSLLLNSPSWPKEWQLEASSRHRGLASGCADEAEIALQVMAAWERSDPDGRPAWELSEAREQWSSQMWINHTILLKAATIRQEILAALSPAMKQEVTRFVEPALIARARAAITRAYGDFAFTRVDGTTYLPAAVGGADTGFDSAGLDPGSLLAQNPPEKIIALRRTRAMSGETVLTNVVATVDWALRQPDSETGQGPEGIRSLELIAAAALHARPEAHRSLLARLQALWTLGMRLQAGHGEIPARLDNPPAVITPAVMPAAVERDAADVDAEPPTTPDDSLTAETVDPDATGWPVPAENVLDGDELEAELQLQALAESPDYLGSCRDCDTCLQGRYAECDQQVQPTSGAEVITPVQTWRALAWENGSLSTPHLRLIGEPPAPDGWLEIVGHDIVDGEPTLLVSASWREDAQPDTPGIHPGLTDGDTLEVVVGATLTGPRGLKFRELHRVVGGRVAGRFVLQEERSCSLQSGARLPGRVIAREAGHTTTLTFVPDNLGCGLKAELPQLSMGEAQDKYGVEGTTVELTVLSHAPDGSASWLVADDGCQARVTRDAIGRHGVISTGIVLHPGRRVQAVVLAVNEHRLKPQLQVALPDVDAPDFETVQTSFPPGEPIAVTFRSATGNRAWFTTGRGVEASAAKADIAAAAGRSVQDLFTAGQQLIAAIKVLEEIPDKRSGGVKLQLAVTIGADALPPEPGAPALTVLPEPGSTALFTVTGFTADGRRAFLVSEHGVGATVTAAQVGAGAVVHLSHFLPSGHRVTARIAAVGENKGQVQLTLNLVDLSLPPIVEQLALAGIVPGVEIDGAVKLVQEGRGMYVTVAPGVDGFVRANTLPGQSTNGHTAGGALRVRIGSVTENRNRPGTPSITLTPA